MPVPQWIVNSSTLNVTSKIGLEPSGLVTRRAAGPPRLQVAVESVFARILRRVGGGSRHARCLAGVPGRC